MVSGLLNHESDFGASGGAPQQPNEDAVARTSKVGKEEMMGPLAAVEEYTQRDHDADMRLWRGLVESIASDLRGISSVTAEVYVPGLGTHPMDPDEDEDDRLGVGVTGVL